MNTNMKFIFLFDGELPSNGDSRKKWQIRKQFAPQLRELWKINPALRYAEQNRYFPIEGGWIIEGHHCFDNEHKRDKTKNDIDKYRSTQM